MQIRIFMNTTIHIEIEINAFVSNMLQRGFVSLSISLFMPSLRDYKFLKHIFIFFHAFDNQNQKPCCKQFVEFTRKKKKKKETILSWLEAHRGGNDCSVCIISHACERAAPFPPRHNEIGLSCRVDAILHPFCSFNDPPAYKLSRWYRGGDRGRGVVETVGLANR